MNIATDISTEYTTNKCCCLFLSCRKVYQTLRHLERKLADNSMGENVILGRVEQLVGRNGLCKCACMYSYSVPFELGTTVCGKYPSMINDAHEFHK